MTASVDAAIPDDDRTTRRQIGRKLTSIGQQHYYDKVRGSFVVSTPKKGAFQQPEIRKIPAHLMPSGNRFELTFDDLDIVREHFGNYGLTPDGHTWERAIVEYCDEIKLDISELEFDSESDLLSVYSRSRDSLENISDVIVKFVADEEALQNVLCGLDVEEDSPEELLRLMAEEGADLSGPVKFEFIIVFPDDSDLKSACQKYTELGYTCFYSDALQVGICHEIHPDLEKLGELHSSINDVAQDFGGKIEVFCDHDEADETLDELEDWVRYRPGPLPPDTLE